MRPRGVLSAWLSHRFQYEGRTMGDTVWLLSLLIKPNSSGPPSTEHPSKTGEGKAA